MSNALHLPTAWPRIIQGGMGVGVSGWRLARAVSQRGQLGVVSGTAIDTVVARRLQDGDPGGHLRRAMGGFPLPGVAAAALGSYFLPGGRPAGMPYRLLAMTRQGMGKAREQNAMLAAYVEVALAKEGHDGPVGINLLTKVQISNLPVLYGAMLAGVDFVLMGAGIPREIPGALDALAAHQPASLRFEIEDAPATTVEHLRLDPREHWVTEPPHLKRPKFLAIVSSHSLATVLARKATGRVDGFVIEGPTAGGHNAPPRGDAPLNERGEPVYGERDLVDLAKMRELGVPFWLAGGAGWPARLVEAEREGAAGIQVGGLFALCDESGITEPLRRSVLESAARGEVDVFTDRRASPTGYPFKVVRWPGDPAAGVERKRVCDLGYLRVPYAAPAGVIGYRCASEPVEHYVAKGGNAADTVGRMCLCNSLLATIGQPQVREEGMLEPPLVTGGDDLKRLAEFLRGRTHYAAGDVLDYLLGADA